MEELTSKNSKRELLEKTALKDSLRLFLNGIDPKSGGKLARALLEMDVELLLALAGALPALGNYLILTACELVSGVRRRFPPSLVEEFVESLLAEMDKDALVKLVCELHAIGAELAPVLDRAKSDLNRRIAHASGTPPIPDFPIPTPREDEPAPCEPRASVFKDILRANLNAATPDSGRNALKAFLADDPEVVLAIVSSLPVAVNSFLGAATELAVQLRNQYPPEMTASFVESLTADIDREALRQCGAAWGALISSAWHASPNMRNQVEGAILKQGPGLAAGFINRCTREVNRMDPRKLQDFLTETAGTLDKAEAKRAVRTLADAFLDQDWGLLSGAWAIVKGRIKKRLWPGNRK